ncbi:Cullin-domain-containing protein, partial [Gyrodon lividus]
SEIIPDEALLWHYAREWDRYTTGAYYVHRRWAPYNKFFIQNERNEGRRSVYPVYTLAIVTWKTHIFEGFHKKISDAVLRLVDRQRNGNVIVDLTPIKKVVESFIVTGIDENDVNKTSLDVYKAHLETPFLEVSRKYFEQKSQSFLMICTPYDFLQQAEECLRVERHIARYFYDDTHNQLFNLDEELLKRMFTILLNIPESLETLRQDFDEHVKRVGLTTMAKLVGADPLRAATPDAKIYVDALSGIHHKYSRLVKVCFRADGRFTASLDRACREFVNRNEATIFSPTISVELIVTHVDGILRRLVRSANEDDIEVALNDVIILFKYIEDKDVFRALYAQKYAQRQVDFISTSKSHQHEARMISKLKVACGIEYTIKIQRMFSESALSQDLIRQFKERMQQYPSFGTQAVDLNILVFGENCWPFSGINEPNSFLIPPEILPTHSLFTKFYKFMHSDRRLTWLWNYSNNELSTNYLTRKYTLLTSSYQMAVLLQFNAHDTRSLEELSISSGIDQKTLLKVLAPLIDAKIVIASKTVDNQYDLNLDFESKKLVLGLTRPSKTEVKTRSSEVMKLDALTKSRLYSIKKSIIRIAKVRKTIREKALIDEVIAYVSQQFQPNILDIKKVIEMLLEDDLIERVEGRRDVLKYSV